MRKYLSLFLTASFLVMSQGVIASPLTNREEIAAASPAPSGQRALQTQATSSSITLMPSDVPPNSFTTLHLLAQTVLVEWMENDPKGTLSLLEVSNGFRRLALPMQGRNDVSVNVSNKLKQHLLAVLIGRQTGDVERFMRDQGNAFKILSVDQLRAHYTNKEFNGTLSPLTRHGRQYLSIEENDLNGGTLRLQRMSLRLAPLNFPGSNGIIMLNLENNNLRVAPDLSHLTLLMKLGLTNNQLTSVPGFSHLTKLNRLDLDHNQLKVLPDLSHLTNLRELGLSHNQLSDVSGISRLTNLRELGLSNNQLSDVPGLSHLTNLTGLSLSNNQLTALPDLSHLTNLTRLWLFQNQLSAVSDLSPLTNLRELDLSNNQLSDVSALSPLTNLRELGLNNNQLSDVPGLSRLMNLRELGLNNNQLSDVPGLSRLMNLRALGFDNNQLKVLPDLSHLTNLTELWLSQNQLSNVSGLSYLTNLKTLYLDVSLCQDETLLRTMRILNRSRGAKNKVKLIAYSKDSRGNDVHEEVPLDQGDFVEVVRGLNT